MDQCSLLYLQPNQTSFSQAVSGSGVTAPSVKSLPCKLEVPSSVSCTYRENSGYGGTCLESKFWGGRDRQTHGTCWPVLPYSVSFRLTRVDRI